MKSTLIEPDIKEEITYPCLMEGKSGLIVLFYAKEKGWVVNSGQTDRRLGIYFERWDMRGYNPLPKGTQVILEQE